MAYYHDVARTIKAVRSFDAFRLFRIIRTMMKTTLNLKLLVDDAGRIGELIPSNVDAPANKHLFI